MNFNYEDEQEKLSLVNDDIQQVLNKYNQILMSLSQRDRNTIQLYYYFKKLDTFKEMTPKGNYWNSRREEYINKVTSVIRKLGDVTFSNYDGLDNLRNLVNNNMNGELLNVINDFSSEIKIAYKRHCDHAYTVLPIHGLKELEESKHRENQYYTSIVDGVFATTSFENIERYIARANVDGMIVHGKEIKLPSNPFQKINDNKVELIQPVSIYLSDIDLFEPQFDFVLESRGNAYFVFDGEWIAPYEKIACVENQTTYLPREFIENNDVYYFEQGEKIQVKNNARNL